MSMRYRYGLAAAATTLFASIAGAQPTLNEDLGALVNGTPVVRNLTIAPNAVNWYKFTIPAVPVGSGGGAFFLDIRTTNAAGIAVTDTEIGLYNSVGGFASGVVGTSSDDDDGPGLSSSLSYGSTCPTRANPAVAPEAGAGTAHNGRDGALAAGDYYLAVVRFNSTFATPWAPTVPTTGTTGSMDLEILFSTTSAPGPTAPTISAGTAAPAAVNSGAVTLFTATGAAGANSCGDLASFPNNMTIDLSPLGGSATAQMFDDATNGDVTAGDNIWSLSYTTTGAASGAYSLVATATNSYALTGTRNISLGINGNPFNVKISQLNGSGGGQGAAGPNCDYVEVHNADAVTANLSGWSLQVATATGTAWSVTSFPSGFTIPAGGYALVRLGTPSATGFAMVPDVTGTSTSLTTTGKALLATTSTAFTVACPASAAIMDLVGYGTTTNCREGASTADNAPALVTSNTNAIHRGCIGNGDTNINVADFVLSPSAPRNLSSPASSGALSAVAAGTPTILVAPNSVLITASAASCGPAPTGVSFTANLTSLDGSATQAMFDDGSNGDVTAGDGTFSYSHAVPNTVTGGNKTVPVVGTDSLSRTANASVSIVVDEAGDVPSTAKLIDGVGPITSIAGNMATNDADMFRIHVCDPATFSASTVGGTTVDTQLWLFRADGTGITMDDDHVGGTTLQSALSSQFTAALPAGDYYLAVSQYDKDAEDVANAELWLDQAGNPLTFRIEHIPDGPGAANPLDHWDTITGTGGNYTITLTGVSGTPCGPVCGSADFDGDGDTGTDADIEAFFACLGGNCCALCGSADFDGDGDTGTDADIEAFFRVLGGGQC